MCFAASRLVLRSRPALVRAQTGITPFTLETEITSFVHDPHGAPHRRETLAVRSDGSRSTTSTFLGKIGLDAGETQRTIQFIDGRKVTMFLSLGVKNTWRPLGQAELQRLKARFFNPPPDCSGSGLTLVKYETVEGQRVAMMTHSSDELNWKVTVWLAPELACQKLRYLSYDKQPDGSFKLQTEGKATKLVLGEPDPAMFEEPAGFREVRPSEAGRMVAEKYHIPISKEMQEDFDRGDRAYSGTLYSPR
jgi:hypothetical protein